MSFSKIQYLHFFCFRALLRLSQALQKSNWIWQFTFQKENQMITVSFQKVVSLLIAPLFLALSVRAQVPDKQIDFAQNDQVEQQLKTKLKSCRESRALGKQDAEFQHSSSGWFLGGVGSGILLGIIGTGIITAAGATSNPQPMDVPEDVMENCYRDGYRSKCRGKNAGSAFGGGLLGTVVIVGIIVASSQPQ